MGFSFFKSKNREKQKVNPEIAAGLNGERSSNPQVSIKLAEHFLRENKRELAVNEYMNAAQSFLEKRQAQLAMAVYRNIITIDPERYSVYETLADLYLKSGFPGDCASELLALAYQYKTAGCDSEVKRVLDSVLEFAPDNPVLKRKVEAFFAAEGGSDAGSQKPAASSSRQAPVSKAAAVPSPQESEDKPEPVVKTQAASLQVQEPALQPVPDAPAKESVSRPEAEAKKPSKPDTTDQPFFDLKSALVMDAASEQPKEPASEPDVFAKPAAPAKPDAALGQEGIPAEPLSEPEIFAQPAASAKPDAAPGQEGIPAEPLSDPEISAKPAEPDATARSFFDLQSALAMDASLGFNYDSSSENLLNAEQEGSLFSVLNVVKNIAEQDPRQDTPLFHFNLGIAYMECGDYEQAVDEFLSALYGTSDKIECYVRLAECSLKLQRRELACGFLREALDHPDISSEQDHSARKLLDEISES